MIGGCRPRQRQHSPSLSVERTAPAHPEVGIRIRTRGLPTQRARHAQFRTQARPTLEPRPRRRTVAPTGRGKAGQSCAVAVAQRSRDSHPPVARLHDCRPLLPLNAAERLGWGTSDAARRAIIAFSSREPKAATCSHASSAIARFVWCPPRVPHPTPCRRRRRDGNRQLAFVLPSSSRSSCGCRPDPVVSTRCPSPRRCSVTS